MNLLSNTITMKSVNSTNFVITSQISLLFRQILEIFENAIYEEGDREKFNETITTTHYCL